MTTILQISDTHIVRPGGLVSERLDTAKSLENLVGRIVANRSHFGQVDAVLVTGDLSDDGSAESYAHFKSLMAPLGAPIFAIPGNHDLRDPMRDAFKDGAYLPPSGKLNWHQTVGMIDIIGLDTLIEGSGGGEIDTETLAFLDAALAAGSPRPVLLAMHHPPFDSGIAFMDRIGLAGRQGLEAVLKSHDTDVRIVCGHIHNTMISDACGKTAISCPSPCSTFAFNVASDGPVGFMDQEDGFMVHRWQNGFQSVRIPTSVDTGSVPF